MRFDLEIERKYTKDTLMDILGIEFIETDDEKTLEATMPVTIQHSQSMGVLHGGATISLAESLAGIGSNIICGNDEQCFGMQISCNHVSSAQIGDTVKAIGTILHKGRTTHVWNVDVFSETTKKLISTVRVTNAVVKKVIYTSKK